MAGGGGSSGGALVQQTAPWASSVAGGMMSQAAGAASDALTKQLNTAIQSMNTQYMDAARAIQPYTQTGVQALDQLNQYLGLNPYNPGSSPVAPTAPTLESELAKVKNSDILNYINQNSFVTPVGNNIGQMFGHQTYIGAGSEDPSVQAAFAWGAVPAGEKAPGGVVAINNTQQVPTAASAFFNNQTIRNAARTGIAQDALTADQTAYDQARQAYNIQMDNYNNAMNLYNQYSAAGPLTSEQITQNITNLPGYQAQLQAGTNAIQNAASAKGYLGSGRALKELMSFGQNTLSTFYGDQLNRLANLASSGQKAATQQSNLNAQQGNDLASLYNSLGTGQANSILAGANAQAQALINANQQYSIMGGQDSGGGLGGIGSLLGSIGSLASSFGGL